MKKLFHNANIATYTDQKPYVQFLVVDERGIITHSGSMSEMGAYSKKDYQTIDLENQFVYPGFVESHGHILSLGRQKETIELRDCRSIEEVVEKVLTTASKKAPGTWILGRGWNQHNWPNKAYPTLDSLQKIHQHPVALTRIDGHALWANQLALQLSGISGKPKVSPPGGSIVNDCIFIDEAIPLIEKHIPKKNFTSEIEALKRGLSECSRFGITSFHDAGSDLNDIEVYKHLFQEKDFDWPLRLYVMINGLKREQIDVALKAGPQVHGDDEIVIRCLKLFADGALGSCGAHLFENYQNAKHRGLELMQEEEITSITLKAIQHNFQVATHAIGDMANHLVLNAYEKAGAQAVHRLRIEHAELLAPSDVGRFAKLGVIASMQPTHLTSDLPWLPQTIGEERTFERTSLWKSLLMSGARMCSGSDVPIELINPFHGIEALLTRNKQRPSETLSLHEALFSFTQAGAYASFLENKIGKLMAGYSADFFTTEKDFWQVSPTDFRAMKIDQTFFRGRKITP